MMTRKLDNDPADEWLSRPTILNVEECVGPDCRRVLIETQRGSIETQLYETAGAQGALMMIGGTAGGFDSPAMNAYYRLAQQFQREGFTALRVRYRDSRDLGEAIHDTIAATLFLEDRGARRLAIVGHSFGGAVAIMTGVAVPTIQAVVTLATQAFGTRAVSDLAPRPLLLLHGEQDSVNSAQCSQQVFRAAREPKELRLFRGAGHGLDEVADEVCTLICGWIKPRLQAEGGEAVGFR